MNRLLVYQWTRQVSKYFSDFYRPQQKRLARFSLGVALAKHCHHSRIAEALTRLKRNVKADSYERQLRDFTADKKFDVAKFSAAWGRWAFNRLPQGKIFLLVDETTAGTRFRAMMVGAAFGRRCIHLAWRCYEAGSEAGYPQGGQVKMIAELLAQVKAVMPKDRQVVVLADRGIGNSPALCREVEALGWSFMFRIPENVKIETEEGVVLPIEKAKPGKGWRGSGTVFVKRGQIQAHVRVYWEEGHAKPWILVTNDPDLIGDEYGLRNWHEQAFRDLKNSGWKLKQSAIRCHEKMARFLAILALAHGMALALGSIAVAEGKARKLIRREDGTLRAAISLFNEGLRYLQRELIMPRRTMPQLKFIPDGRW